MKTSIVTLNFSTYPQYLSGRLKVCWKCPVKFFKGSFREDLGTAKLALTTAHSFVVEKNSLV